MTRRFLLLSLLVGLAAARPTAAQETNAPPAAPSLSHRLLWYLPNRILDIADIFRARVRVGPGAALSLRITKHATLYAGEYHSAYLGLPGPRGEPSVPSLVGLEREKGLAFLGVDATDDLPHEPGYSSSEIAAGVHAGIVGAEAGFDLIEAADFVLGIFLVDLRRDDH